MLFFQDQTEGTVIEENEYFKLTSEKMYCKGFHLSGNGYAHPMVTKFDAAKPAASACWQRASKDEAYAILFHHFMLARGAKWAVQFPSWVVEWAKAKTA